MNVSKLSIPQSASSIGISHAKVSSETSDHEPSVTMSTSNKIKKYDFTNITRSEFKNILNDLIQTGQISLDESSSLLYAMPDQSIINDSDPHMKNESVDVFSILIQSIAFNQSIGNDSGILYDTKAFNTLMRFQDKTFGLDMSV